ncbi:MAG: hypothetical protein Q8N23_35945 [Archangium sp.]|nr:hypothetical protein [Archangium sp.]MDP3158120.1 hypothetical protein [Archangium sp.]MDP3570473.1 hypothetical protein [Archangium sp.]
MRLLSALVVLSLFACTESGPAGEKGEPGARGETGAVGPVGPQGDKGDQGERGPQGAVLVLDGGVVTGPQGPQGVAGSSVTVTQLPPGNNRCPAGGVVLSLGDAGVTDAGTFICNGAAGDAGAVGPGGPVGPVGPAGAIGPIGPAGPVGPAGGVGPIGPTGPAGGVGPIGPVGPAGGVGPIGPVGPAGGVGPIGPAGASVTVTVLSSGDVNCPWGGSRFVAGSTTGYACNGAPGASSGGGGGSADGGTSGSIVVVGITPLTYSGNLGGRPGAHALCSAAYAGSHLCSSLEYVNAPNSVTIPAGGAWVDGTLPGPNERFDRTQNYTCSMWTSNLTNSGTEGTLVLPQGSVSTSYVSSVNSGCQTPRPLVCCTAPTRNTVRGLTPTASTGNLGGRPAANALCAAAFPRSHFCSSLEYVNSPSYIAAPAGGAWVDGTMPGTGSRVDRTENYTCSLWTSALTNSGTEGTLVLPSGALGTSYISSVNSGCQTARPLYCCE